MSVRSLKGQITVPGDKSISHRAVMLGALAHGRTTVENFLMGEDCLSTIACFRKLGIAIAVDEGKNHVEIEGKGIRGLTEASDILPVGNSGTTTRLISGILSGQPFYSVLSGDQSLNSRPMKRVIEPLSRMGARIYGRKGNTCAPLTIIGKEKLAPIEYSSPIASAQVKSAIILAGLYGDGVTKVTEPSKSRDHTERMLTAFGAKVETGPDWASVSGGQELHGREVLVPGDISSAAFFLVAGSIVPGSEILIRNVGVNPTRTGILEALKAMGADISLLDEREASGEPVADLLVKSAPLKGTEIGGEIIPRLIDEIPILAVAAAAATGRTVIRNAEDLRAKESDRIKALADNLSRLGVPVEEQPDGLVIEGKEQISGGSWNTYFDHRMAMSGLVIGLVSLSDVIIDNEECVSVSFPGFINLLKGLQGK